MERETAATSQTTGFDFSIALRIIGVLILLFGITIVVKVVDTAWQLFTDSDAIIVPFSEKIEEQSGINQIAKEILEPALFQARQMQRLRELQTNQALRQGDGSYQQTPSEPAQGDTDTATKPTSLNIAYFASWMLVILLLGVVSRIGVSIISVGGSIASESYWRKFTNRLLRSLIAELRVRQPKTE